MEGDDGGVPIAITKVGDRYSAVASEPEIRHGQWETTESLEKDDLISILLSLGAHQTDIGDALYSADPELLEQRLKDIPD